MKSEKVVFVFKKKKQKPAASPWLLTSACRGITPSSPAYTKGAGISPPLCNSGRSLSAVQVPQSNAVHTWWLWPGLGCYDISSISSGHLSGAACSPYHNLGLMQGFAPGLSNRSLHRS